MTSRSLIFLIIALVAAVSDVIASEFVVLSPENWDEFAPLGKEVDAIYGDYVLRNDQIVAVIAQAIPGRKANMTVRDVGGCVIDLTARDSQSDQLSAYYPGARAYRYKAKRLRGRRNVSAVMKQATTRSDRMDISLAETQSTDIRVQADELILEFESEPAQGRPAVQLFYVLKQGDSHLEIRSRFVNKSGDPLKVSPADDFRADRSFETHKAGPTELAWTYDKWWGQCYAVTSPTHSMTLAGNASQPRRIDFRQTDATALLKPGEKRVLTRNLIPSESLVGCKAIGKQLRDPKVALSRIVIEVIDKSSAVVPNADVAFRQGNQLYGSARTGANGRFEALLPAGDYQIEVSEQSRGKSVKQISVQGTPQDCTVELESPGIVVGNIQSQSGGPIPCKVQFLGIDGTKNPFFFPDTGEHAVHNLVYSHNGSFRQEVPPGDYQVLISYGPEYHLERRKVEVRRGKTTELTATMRRAFDTPGWVSTEFHSHSTPSGDNVSSQRGRVLNHLCEHLEYNPCTEHNRLDSYAPHLKALGVEHLMGTCVGLELTGSIGTLNHQNAFPFIIKPNTQDNGAPDTHPEPEVQISRIALWDNRSEKLIQTNHPDMGWMFFDKNGDGKLDNGYEGMFGFQDVIEVHPHWDILKIEPYRNRGSSLGNNSIFNWLQLLNQGHRLPAVVNTDAHYNFHGTGWLRNYVRCETEDPARIKPLEMVRASEAGHIVLSNGPFLDVSLSGQGRAAIPGADIELSDGKATLSITVKCANWLDVDRVQVLFNGRPQTPLNWTRATHRDAFSDESVKFTRKVPLELSEDTHIIVVATGENHTLGDVFGPAHRHKQPTAVSNPIFVDVDGSGFTANKDTLGHPLPIKGVPKEAAETAIPSSPSHTPQLTFRNIRVGRNKD